MPGRRPANSTAVVVLFFSLRNTAHRKAGMSNAIAVYGLIKKAYPPSNPAIRLLQRLRSSVRKTRHHTEKQRAAWWDMNPALIISTNGEMQNNTAATNAVCLSKSRTASR